MMRIHRTLAAAIVAAAAASASASVIYNPVVTMIGDGTPVVSGQSRTTAMRVYANSLPAQPLPLSELAFNSSSSGVRLTNSDSATSEGGLSNNPGTADAAAVGTVYSGTIYTFSAGYDAPNATSAVIGTAVNANRVGGFMNATGNTLSASGIPVSQTQASAYDNNNLRSATGDDSASNIWTGGTGTTAATAGWRHLNSNTQVTTTNSTNVRSVEIRNNQLFGSTGSATRGVYFIASPAPTSSGNVASLLVGTGASSSPYEFVLIDDPSNAASTATTFGYDTAYIADDSAIGAANGGIQKWVWNGATWANAYTLNDGVGGNRGLAGQLDVDTGKVTLWASTADGTKLEQVTDNGVGGWLFITLATAPANNIFRGVALTTLVPEPGSLAVLAIASMCALRRRTK